MTGTRPHPWVSTDHGEHDDAQRGEHEDAQEPEQADERGALIRQLERTQADFERRALSAMADPLISTPLTMQQLKVLITIAIDPEHATGQNLAALLHVSLASMSQMVDRLVDHDMVRRTEDPADRRVRRLSVTAEGSETLRSLLSAGGTMPTPVLRLMALDDLRALVRGITALDRAATELEGSAPD